MTTPKPIGLGEDGQDDYLDRAIDRGETPKISTLGSALSNFASLCRDILSEAGILSSISGGISRLTNRILGEK